MEIIAPNPQVDGVRVEGGAMKPAIMALSGGMDSSSLLLHLLREGYNVTAISFNYGQSTLLNWNERLPSLLIWPNMDTKFRTMLQT